MITSLSIKNYALIEKLSIDFSKGFSTITGETGAGKSIILGALGLVLGKRADLTSLKNKEEKCVIEAHFEFTDQAGADDNAGKHIELFKRRATKGQCFQQPCLGNREFSASFELLESLTDIPVCHEQLKGERDLGWMLWDIDFANGMTPRFFRASMSNGIITIPSMQEAVA